MKYEGCPRKRFTRAPVKKLSICWEPNAYQTKDIFIRKKKVFHKECWISNSLTSTQPEREVTLKTPTNLLSGLLLEPLEIFSQLFLAEYHCYIQKCYHKSFHLNAKSFYTVLNQFYVSGSKNGQKLGPEKKQYFLKILLASKCLDLRNSFTYHFEEH